MNGKGVESWGDFGGREEIGAKGQGKRDDKFERLFEDW